jgi:hypothetical protein
VNDRIHTGEPPVKPSRRIAQKRRGIQTVYAGINFRSRHEATWAAFFDGLGLKWDFEPEDLDGYIPDFRINFKLHPLLVEIKPNDKNIDLDKSKIDCSGWDGDVAILISGADRFVGWFREDNTWDRAVLAACLVCTKPTIVHEGGRWACRSCAASNRSIWWAFNARPAWADAKNKAQWRPKK